MADLDNLKMLNDDNGHHCGDRALKLLASVLRQAARETDVVGRLGGDEFALLLHESDQDAAMATATRLRAAMHDVTGSDWVTASIGVSTWQGPDDTPDALLRRADEALYVAKRSGRNCAAGGSRRRRRHQSACSGCTIIRATEPLASTPRPGRSAERKTREPDDPPVLRGGRPHA